MNSVKAKLKYLAPGEEKPVYYASRGGSTAQLNLSGSFETHEVTITNARSESPSGFNLDTEGFTLVQHHAHSKNLYDEEQIKNSFLPEVEALVAKVTGARRVVAFDFTLRSDSEDVRGDRQSREPSTVVHNDYTEKSGPQRVRDLFGGEEAELLVQRPFQIVNLWRTITNPVESTPLAVCDAQSVEAGDLVDVVRIADDRTGELTMAYHNPAHAWYFFNIMKSEEALLIKTFDSDPDAVAKNCIHTAFYLPDQARVTMPRESIEVRNFVFY